MPDASTREREIFIAALELTNPTECAAYLDGACGGDAALRASVGELLRAFQAAGEFLAERPVGGVGASGHSAAPRTATDAIVADAPILEGPGNRIGRYKLLECIGEGGFGVVYMAEQEEPVRRRVALKIIKLGMDTRAVIARFEAERQALAMMDHPNIAKVLDGGATEAGRPYFVMELVRGTPITTFCDEQRLPVPERIELFSAVCHAVQHAHQKGVIHRDLKPTNILVALHDDKPVPVVIDFGIAKATQQRLTEKTLFTRFHHFIGTPAYMSPEQTGAGDLDVDTRTDIYSLGVLLYELLSGHTPFDAQTLRGAALDEIHRIIREAEPPSPSRRVASLSREEQTTAAGRRRNDPAKLTSHLQGDLDRIVMKCLAKDRTRRYETANALAMDLARHLNNEPVLAQRDTLAYRSSKFVRRHRRGVATTAVVSVVLIGLVVFYTVRLAAERDRARYEAAKARRVSELLTSLLTGADPYGQPDPSTVTVRGLLERGAERIDKELGDQPELQAEMFTEIGRAYVRLGLHDKAQPLLERALAAERQTGADRERIAKTLIELGVLQRERGNFELAESLLSEALAIRRAHYPPGNEIAFVLVDLGRTYLNRGLLEKAEPLFREALAMRRTTLGEEDKETAVSYGDLGVLLLRKDDFAAAEPLLRAALAINRKVNPNHPNLAGAMTNVGQVLANKGDHSGAEALYRESIAMFRSNVGEKHWRVAIVLNNLSAPLREQAKYDEAIAVLKEALEIVQASLGREHTLVAFILGNLARVCLARGEFAEAESRLREALRIQTRTYPESNPRLAVTKSLLGAALTQRQQFEEAEALLLSAAGVLKGLNGPESRESAANRNRLVTLYESWGQPEKAARYRTAAP